jgi:site-specific DNA-cytosine methylase
MDDLRRVYERAQKFSAKKDPNSAASDPNSSASDPKVIRLDETVVGQNSEENRMKLVSTLKELELRYFTPIEIAKLLGFPAGQCSGESQIKFEFPPDFSGNSTQAYRVLGNSLSVTTVSLLTSLLFLKF